MATNNLTLSSILFALLGGVVPAIVWLVFWLREDEDHPESPMIIAKTFLGGMCAVALVLPFQKLVDIALPGMGTAAFVLWAVIEEAFKFGIAYFIAIRGREDDEPIDSMIYMITVALGFVAVENALFIINPIIQRDVADAISTGSLRFIGASLLHIVSSASIGTALALTFYKNTNERTFWVTLSFCGAVFIHTAFNLFILNQSEFGALKTFSVVWAGVTLLLLFFERVKSMQIPNLSTGDSSPPPTIKL